MGMFGSLEFTASRRDAESEEGVGSSQISNPNEPRASSIRNTDIRRAFTVARSSRDYGASDPHPVTGLGDANSTPQPSKWSKVLSMLRCERNGEFMFEGWIHTTIWKVLIGIFTILLLFGVPIQNLCIPKAGDQVFDVLYTLAFAFFVVDIAIRLQAEPSYFTARCLGKGCGDESYFAFGSFMMWCDLISTATLLYDISFINKPHYGVQNVNIILNDQGQPVRSFTLMKTSLVQRKHF